MSNANEPAFAAATIGISDSYVQEGLTKREYFAIHLLSGLSGADISMSLEGKKIETEDQLFTEVARAAVRMTDALLAELDRRSV